MVLYSKCLCESLFSGEKIDLKIRYLVAKILSKNGVSFFWDTLYICVYQVLHGQPQYVQQKNIFEPKIAEPKIVFDP